MVEDKVYFEAEKIFEEGATQRFRWDPTGVYVSSSSAFQ
jgi:hypothetical protein